MNAGLPPSNPEAEQGVLGSLLFAPAECAPILGRMLAEPDFHNPVHGIIYVTAMRLWADFQTLDVVLITNALRKAGKLEAVGGAAFLSSLIDFTPTAANASYYADAVLEKARLRKIWTVSRELHIAASEPSADLDALSATLSRLQADLAATNGGSAKAMQDHVSEALARYEANYENRNAVPAGVIPTGIERLDAYLTGGGLRPSRLVIVAAETSFGKTALALLFGVQGAIHRGEQVLIVSYEMEADELTDRLVSLVSGVSGFKLAGGLLNEADFIRLTTTTNKLAAAGIHLRDDVGHWTVADIASEARAIKARHGLGLIIVDYLQLAAPAPAAKGRQVNREREVAEMSRSLKALAKEMKVPVVALSQLTDGRLRESRAIGHDSDLTLRIQESIDPNTNTAREDEREIVIDKQRGGPRDKTVKVGWDGPTTRFS